jgi:ribosomal-protein-alanine N-acetyltransferase
MYELEDLQILDMEFSDVAQIQEIARRLNLSHWSNKDYKSEVGKKYSITKVGKLNKRVVGFVVARLIIYQSFSVIISESIGYKERCEAEKYEAVECDSKQIDVDIEIYNISVVEKLQNRGIGKKLLETLHEAGAKYKSAKVWLEVRESNTNAINFYKANDFEVCCQRRNFYVNPIENALVMKREIN